MRMGYLDGMRGILALGVGIYHLSGENSFAGYYIAVDLFMIMSGFVLCHAYMRQAGNLAPMEFLGRRLARLYPVYFAAGAIFAFMLAVGYPITPEAAQSARPDYGASGFWSYFLATQAFPQLSPDRTVWIAPGWSLSVELWVGLALFCLMPLLARGGRHAANACFALAIVIYMLLLSRHENLCVILNSWFGITNAGTLRGIAAFAIGYALYARLPEIEIGAGMPRWVLSAVEIAAFAGVIIVPACLGWQTYDLFVIAAFVVLIALLVKRGDESAIARLLASRPLLFLGTVSYSFYLLHTVSGHVMTRMIADGVLSGGAATITLTVILTLALSWLSVLLIERPGQKWGLRLIQTLKSRRYAATALA